MAESVRPPVAIRIVRPYDSEDDLLEHELETIGKTSVVLIGAHPRPTGVILRFEVTLASGITVLRGEGRVLAHKENAFRGQPGLTLRFTRLDPRSKSVVDRATAMREARSTSDASSPSRPSVPSVPSQPAIASPHAESPVADALTASTPAPGPTSEAMPVLSPAEAAAASARAVAREKANATARANARRTGSGRPMALTPPPAPSASAPPATAPSSAPDEPATPAPTPVTSVPGQVAEGPRATASPAVTPPAAAAPAAASARRGVQAASTDAATRAPIEPPPDRAELLARLRERAGKLPPERVEAILSARR